ncbi:MAG: PilW family protein [Gammaproteobacteria bacterium]|nr:PilW family protein [Gammaproteobacteria bacterium]
MQKHQLTKYMRSIYGFSVIELMVALAITAFLLIGLVQIFSSVRASYDLQEGLGRLQENARFASTFMSQQLREVGYFPFAETQKAIEDPTVVDMGFLFPAILNGTVPFPVTLNSTDGGGLLPDTLEVNLYDEYDCSGNLNPVTAVGTPAILQKQIQFNHNPATNELRFTCRIGVPNPTPGFVPPVVINNQPILNNVETIQFQYGQDRDGDGTADIYTDGFNAISQGDITAIRVGLILTSPIIGTLPPDDQTITLMNMDFAATGIRQLRRPVVFNISLRNATA